MKITNTSIETIAPNGASATGKAGAIGSDSGLSTSSARSTKADSVDLSSASQLVSLAKSLGSADQSAKTASVAALVRSGQYSTDTASVSHAVVQGHIQ